MFKTKPNKYTEICGWYGMIALISAYGLASYGVIGAQSLEFQLLNITGSIGMMIVALLQRASRRLSCSTSSGWVSGWSQSLRSCGLYPNGWTDIGSSCAA